jgi:flagellin-like protein
MHPVGSGSTPHRSARVPPCDLGAAELNMEFKQLFADDDAVSPVIGVILMVAITVILAAVIGTFVLGLGDQVSNTSPQASFTFDFDEDSGASTTGLASSGSGDKGYLIITHDGGEQIDSARLDVTDGTDTTEPFSGTVTAGTSVTVNVYDTETVRVVWTSANGGDTATLGKWTGPDA